jgi:cytochrome b561
MHVAAALFHHFVRRDGVLRRMLPGIGTRGD